MIEVAAKTANVRKQKILESVRSMQLDTFRFGHLGISVDSEMTKIQGQRLFSMFEN